MVPAEIVAEPVPWWKGFYSRSKLGVVVMRRLALVIGLFAILALSANVLAAPARATGSQAVFIRVETFIDSGGGPFTATGPICPSGETSTLFANFVGGQSGSHAQILIGKQFTCGDGTGTFELLLRVELDFATGNTTGTWNVLSGTGAYEKLHGTGDVVGTPEAPGVTIDVYTGAMHID